MNKRSASASSTGMFVLLLVLVQPELARAAAFTLPENGDTLVGAVTSLRLAYEDTLAGVAQKYQVGYQELLDANPGVDPWIPGEGTVIKMPTAYLLPDAPRDGLVINVAEYRLYYYPKGGQRVITYPVGVGREEYQTPLLKTKVTGRIENPSWTPTADARREHAEMGDILPHVVPPGPDNPLGNLAIQLAEPGYFIHGTNKPFGVGQMVSHGCIRLYDPHIATLAEMVPSGTPVYIVNQPVKVGWRGADLYIESHRELYAESDRVLFEQVIEKAVAKRQENTASVDWRHLDNVLQDMTGVPVKF